MGPLASVPRAEPLGFGSACCPPARAQKLRCPRLLVATLRSGVKGGDLLYHSPAVQGGDSRMSLGYEVSFSAPAGAAGAIPSAISRLRVRANRKQTLITRPAHQ